MEITLDSDLEAALNEAANRLGVTPRLLVLSVLRERFQGTPALREPQDDWERRLRSLATDCGVSLPDWAVSSEGLYD